MSNETISKKCNDELTPWVKRIKEAVTYRGHDDHEDVRSILEDFSSKKDIRIKQLERDAKEDAEIISMLQDCKAELEKSVTDLQCLVPKKLTKTTTKTLKFKKAQLDFESYGLSKSWNETKDYVFIQFFNKLCTKYGATLESIRLNEYKHGDCVVKVKIVGAQWGPFLSDVLNEMGPKMDKIRYTR